MALSGTVNGSVTNNSKYFSFYFTWEATQSISGNYSDVTVNTYWSTNDKWQEFDTVGSRAASITINGETTPISKVFAVYWRQTGTTYLIQTATTRVYHNSDGTKSITISARANGHAKTYGTSASTASSDDCTASTTVTLDTIPRVSVPTLSASTVKMGNVLTIKTNRMSSSFTHTLKYSFGGTTANIATGVGDSYEWTVPDLASKCIDELEGSCTITCITYSGSTEVGKKTVEVTFAVPDATTPNLSASSVTMGNTLTITTSGKSASYTHTLKYTFGGMTATIISGVKSSYGWAVPDLASKCNNALEGSCTITCITYNGSVQVGSKTVTVTLKVPDATVPSFPNGNVIIGSSNTIGTDIRSKNFTHTVTYSFNGASGTIVEKGTSSFVWWVTGDTAKSLAKAIPNKTSGEGTLTCTTYNGTATVGSKTITFTAVVPNNDTTKPKISAMTLSPVSSLPSAFNGLYLQRKSKVAVDITADTEYSTIASYKMTVQNKSYSGDPCTSDVLAVSGSTVIKGIVTDARGYTSDEAEQTITVIPYELPNIVKYSGEDDIICARCASDGTLSKTGQYLRIKAGRSYSKVMSESTQKNFCLLQYRYRLSTSDAYSDSITLLSASDNSDEVDVIIPDVVASLVSSYKIQLIATDTVGETARYTFDISTASTDFHLREGGRGAAFGKYAEKDDVLESDWDVEFYKDLAVTGDFKAGHIKSIAQYDSLDFNELIYKTGYYIGMSVPSTAGCSNYPIDKTGVLEVISAMKQDATTLSWWGFAYQTYRSHDGQIYTRSYAGDGWTSWTKMATA